MKKIVSALIASTMLFALAGCGFDNQEKAYKPSLDPEITGKINVAGHYNNFEALEAEFNRFNEFYPGVELTYTYLDNYNNIIATTLESADAPDIFFTYAWTSGSEESRKLLENAENLADESLGINLSCVRDGLLYRAPDGSVPMVPIYTTTYGMMVNENIFEKEGIAVPSTYSELLNACEALKNAGYSSPMMGFNRSDLLTYPLFYPYFVAGVKDDSAALTALNNMDRGAGEYARPAFELVDDFMKHGYIDLDACNALGNDYGDVIMRFFEGDVPMMLATANTVSGTEKRESQSEAFAANPFKYSFRPVPSTEDGGYFINSISLNFSVNKNSQNLDITNEFMRFLITTPELNRMAKAKRMVTPCKDMSLDSVYAVFGELESDQIIYPALIGLDNAPGTQVRIAGWQISNGMITVDEAISAFGTLE